MRAFLWALAAALLAGEIAWGATWLRTHGSVGAALSRAWAAATADGMASMFLS